MAGSLGWDSGRRRGRRGRIPRTAREARSVSVEGGLEADLGRSPKDRTRGAGTPPNAVLSWAERPSAHDRDLLREAHPREAVRRPLAGPRRGVLPTVEFPSRSRSRFL